MKTILTLAAILISLLSFSQTKTAHINYNELVRMMPATTEATTTIDALTKKYQAELAKIEAEFKQKSEAYKKEEASLSPAIKELRIKEIQNLEASYKNFKDAAVKEINQKDKDLFTPIFEKCKAAVVKVATSKGYSYVIDSGKGEYVYLDPKGDLMELVKKELGLN